MSRARSLSLRLLPVVGLVGVGLVARRRWAKLLGAHAGAVDPSLPESPFVVSGVGDVDQPIPAGRSAGGIQADQPYELDGLDQELRDDARYERRLFVRLLVILLIVAIALAVRALFL